MDENTHIKKNPLISILMNCYNGEKYLKEALESVLSQIYENWELIFWDNKSTDESANIFNSYNDNRFKYYSASTHTNLGEGRKNAVKKVSGEWIAFLDTDDVWLNNKLSRQIEIINNNINDHLGLIYSKTYYQYTNQIKYQINKKIENKQRGGMIFKHYLFNNNFIPFVSALISKKAYDKVGGFSPKYSYASDYHLFISISKYFFVKYVPDYLTIYRIHDNNLSWSMNRTWLVENKMILLEYVKDYPFIVFRVVAFRLRYFIKKLKNILVENF